MKRRRPELPTRRYRRLTVRIQVEYQSDDGTRHELATTLGAGGLFVTTESPLSKGTLLHVRFSLPGSTEVWKLPARVAWTDDAGMGLEFLDRSHMGRLALALDVWQRD